MINERDIIELLSDLVKINSVNPWLVKGGAGEAQIGKYIADWLEPLGLDVRLDAVEDGRKNLVARLKGTGGGKSLCLYAHLDTVGFSLWKDQALSPVVKGDRLYGLGSADDKGHCAIAMLVLKSLLEGNVHLRGDVWMALPIDEEGTSSGTMYFVNHYKPDTAIVLEPFGLGSISVTHQGFGWLDIVVRGKAAHGSAPDTGIDAIVHMAEVITRLQRLDNVQFAPSPHPLNDKTVFHTSTIVGGTDYATYPGSCVLGIEIGTQPGETIQDRAAEIEAIFEQVKTIYPKFEAEVQVKLARDPFNTQGSEDLWEVLSAEIERITGEPVKASGENAWGDAALFQEAGIPTLSIGAYGENIHAPDEWVSLSDLGKLGKLLEATIIRFCA